MAPFEDNAPNLAAAVIPLAILGCIVLPLRIHVRASNHALGWDDWCMIVAAVRAEQNDDEGVLTLRREQIPWAALSATCIGGAFNGIGVHEAKLTPEQRIAAMMVRSIFRHRS